MIERPSLDDVLAFGAPWLWTRKHPYREREIVVPPLVGTVTLERRKRDDDRLAGPILKTRNQVSGIARLIDVIDGPTTAAVSNSGGQLRVLDSARPCDL